MLNYQQFKVFLAILTCYSTSAQNRRFLLEVKSNGKCEGDLLKAVNASAFSCMSSCDAEPQCDVANIMEEQGRCELLSNDASLPVATKTADGWSCYNKTKIDYCSATNNPETVFPCCVLGTSRCVPARSCLHLTTACPSYAFESGLYWILGRLNAIQMFCDMETYGGGWTKVASVNETFGSAPDHTTYLTDDITVLDRATKNFFKLSGFGLRDLRGIIQFTQLRVFCYKPSINRTIHIATTKSAPGYAVVAYMTLQADTLPSACGSYNILPDDTSILSKSCNSWAGRTWSISGTPRSDRLYDHTGFISDYVHILAGSRNLYMCDDWVDGPLGIWEYFVR